MSEEAARSRADTAIVLLAGGRATRFPGKLEQPVGGVPMVARVFRTLRSTPWPVYVAANGSLSPGVEALLDAPMLRDDRPGRGPLGAMLSACSTIQAPRLFAIAADQPRLEAGVLHRLAEAWQPGDEAIVPEHEGRIEPLAALYARTALLGEGLRLLDAGEGAMHRLIERVAVRFVPMPAHYFHNVNTVADLSGETSWDES
jgi:molybdopterin-guanine dinucleotide biosynthesis protein A